MAEDTGLRNNRPPAKTECGWSPDNCRNRERRTESPPKRTGHTSRPSVSSNGSSTTGFSTATTPALTPRTTLTTVDKQQEAVRFRGSEHTVEELTDRLADMKAEIQDWEDEFEVESLNQLRDARRRVP